MNKSSNECKYVANGTASMLWTAQVSLQTILDGRPGKERGSSNIYCNQQSNQTVRYNPYQLCWCSPQRDGGKGYQARENGFKRVVESSWGTGCPKKVQTTENCRKLRLYHLQRLEFDLILHERHGRNTKAMGTILERRTFDLLRTVCFSLIAGHTQKNFHACLFRYCPLGRQIICTWVLWTGTSNKGLQTRSQERRRRCW